MRKASLGFETEGFPGPEKTQLLRDAYGEFLTEVFKNVNISFYVLRGWGVG